MHKVSNDIKKWVLDESKLSKEDLEVLKIVNFPKKLGYRDAAQKRIKRLQGAGGFIDKQIVDINDLKYVVTPKNIAKSQIQRYSASGTSTAENERNKKIIEGILKAKSYKVEYIDAHYIEEEMHHILSLYSTPKPTPSMKVETINNTKLNKKTKVKKQLTEAQKVTAKEKFQSGEMDIKELAAHLKVTQTLLKEYLKSL
jgi:hypothetical protein